MIHHGISNFEEFAEAIINVDARCMQTGVKRPDWIFSHCEVGSIQIQGGYEGCPLLFEGATYQGYWSFYLRRTGDFGSVNGMRLDSNSVFLIPPSGQFCFASLGEFNWRCVHISTDELFPISCAPRGSHMYARVVKPAYGLVNRLRTAVDQFAQASEIEPSVMAEPASVVNFSETLLTTARQILGFANHPSAEPDRITISRRQLISVAVQLIEECPEKSLSVKVLAQSVGVSERTLRFAFVEYLGTPPLKYLTLRRLHRARMLLQGAAPEELTVSSVAALLGFWDFGRFAGAYRRLFGELPSQTLQRP